MKSSPGPVLASVRRISLVCVLAAVPVTAGAPGARAQGNIDLSTDHVTVDLSVIESLGSRGPVPAPYVVGPTGAPTGGGLLLPEARTPTSKLHVVVPKGEGADRITLRPPGSKPKKRPTRVAKPKPPKAKPKPASPTVAATKPPAALTTAPPPEPATKPVREMAQGTATAAPPAPPPPARSTKAPAPPPPATKPAAMPTPDRKEQASLPSPAAEIKPGRAMKVAFPTDESKLPADAKDGLKALVGKLKEKEHLRLQLMAYAGGKDLSPSKARRMSLSRALSVRSFLIENGIRSTRIDVRALGSKTSEEPLNRVDVNIVER